MLVFLFSFNAPILGEYKPQCFNIVDENLHRQEGFNNCRIKVNGEKLFLDSFVQNAMVVFDVGANKGDWTDTVIKTEKTGLQIHLFEPIPDLRDVLNKRFKSSALHVNSLALSNEEGLIEFYVYPARLQLSSFYDREVLKSGFISEKIYVKMGTLDQYCLNNHINNIDLLKLDVEGAEWKVLTGSKRMISENRIGCVYFEYGGANVDSATTLKQIYKFLKMNGYEVYRLYSKGMLHIKKWSDRLENY
ncbi:MAG: FkbM family methyltransferase, partial [Simkaniaceae bacterium]|nr:FkbM family methyltransferase [Simkaniaceae bacterium]